MSKKPPREGARWGVDPPAPIVGPSGLDDLREQYGEANVSSAENILRKLKNDFPELLILKTHSSENFVRLIMATALTLMDHALKDERPHSLPETLNLLSDQLGKNLARQPDVVDPLKLKIQFIYGDESKGKAARETFQKYADKEIARLDKRKEEIDRRLSPSIFPFIILGIIIGLVILYLG